MIYAHSHPSLPRRLWQTLKEHHRNVGRLTARFAAIFSMAKTGKFLGRNHDVGKQSDEAQKHICGSGKSVDHKTAAYAYMVRSWDKDSTPEEHQRIVWLMQFLGFAFLGHHYGLPDLGSSCTSKSLMEKVSNLDALPDWHPELCRDLPPAQIYRNELMDRLAAIRNTYGNDSEEALCMADFARAMLVRMLHSCLVDADFLDTEAFMDPARHAQRLTYPDIPELAEKFDAYLRQRGFLRDTEENPADIAAMSDKQSALQAARRYYLRQCINKAESHQAVFALNMPTGSGKTLSSMAFALHHAKKHGLRRVIVVMPYTTIIEQNAEQYRQALGDAVLEHHCHYDWRSDENDREMLASENWDILIVVTTSVQFFESFFDNRPSRCRKLHNVADSVIVLDEVQTLPLGYTRPCLAVLRVLHEQYGCSIVLSTATQPAYHKFSQLRTILPSIEDIVPFNADISGVCRHVRMHGLGRITDDDLLQRLNRTRQVLCIVNTRADAQNFYLKLGAFEGDSDCNYCLSTWMTPDDRRKTLASIRQRLRDGKPCRVVSTSVMECGVDISFPVLYREKNGLEAYEQSMGRCSRNWEYGVGDMYYFGLDRDRPTEDDLKRRCLACDRALQNQEYFSQEIIDRYFKSLYISNSCGQRTGKNGLDRKGILSKTIYREKGEKDLDSKWSFWQFDFATIAKNFNFIGQQVGVVINNPECVELIRQYDDAEILPRSVLRKLQAYTVNVSMSHLRTLQSKGQVMLWKGLYITTDKADYQNKMGLM